MTSGGPEPAQIEETLRATPAFAALPHDVLLDLLDNSTCVALDAGESLPDSQQQGGDLLVVLSGALTVSGQHGSGVDVTFQDLDAGALMTRLSVSATDSAALSIRAREAAVVAVISGRVLERFVDRHPEHAQHVLDALNPLLRRERLWRAVSRTDAFQHLDTAALSNLELVSFYAGETVVREGQPGDDLWIVVSGRLRVASTDVSGAETTLAELGLGETVGEMAVISHEPRSATVYAIRDSLLARLTSAEFYQLLERRPRAAFDLVATKLVDRLRDTSQRRRIGNSVATIAIVPAGQGAPSEVTSERLVAAFSQLGSTLHLTSNAVDRFLGTDGAAQAHDRDGGAVPLLEWLAAREMGHRYVVYQADAALSPWTERSVRQADHIVIVGDATGDPTPGEMESLLLASHAARTPRTLILAHRDGRSAPSQTARWLAGRKVQRHIHVALDRQRDFDRVARLIAGSAVGLALGGGFARGLAHLGVFRAMDELGIPVDLVGGSSMGAMIGAMWALGWEPARIAERTTESFRDSFNDMTIPFLSFKGGGSHARVVRTFFGDTEIDDLWVPYFCISTNLNRAEVKIHSSGRLADAVLASTRAPGIFPPVVMSGDLHVDGGLINNVPVDVMRTFSNNGVVIGVDVSPPHEVQDVPDYGDAISGWQAAWRRFNPNRAKRVYHPSILLVLMRVIEFGGISYRREKAESADVYISPDLIRFKRNDFHAAAAIADAGYRAARQALTAWLAGDTDGSRILS
jgi:NTE family protein